MRWRICRSITSENDGLVGTAIAAAAVFPTGYRRRNNMKVAKARCLWLDTVPTGKARIENKGIEFILRAFLSKAYSKQGLLLF